MSSFPSLKILEGGLCHKTLVTSGTVSKNHSVQGITVLKEFIHPNMYFVLKLLSASSGSEKKKNWFAESELYWPTAKYFWFKDLFFLTYKSKYKIASDI